MHCPFCGAGDTKVIDSRLTNEGEAIRRRRECQICSERFTTYEAAELTLPRLIKRNRVREPFQEGKLRAGILRAVEKRPVSTEIVDAAIHRIVHRLRASGERELDSQILGEWVMDELRHMDEVAYVRFASVYRRFQDVHAFREEIERLEQARSPEEKAAQLSFLIDEQSPANKSD